MFESRKELQSKLESAETENARLETELTASNAKVDESANLTQEVAGLNEDLDACKLELETEQAAHTATKGAASTAATEASTALETEQAKTTPEAITKLVTTQLAAAGHPALDLEGGDSAAKGTLLAQYEKLEGEAKWKFLSENSAALNAEARKTK